MKDNEPLKKVTRFKLKAPKSVETKNLPFPEGGATVTVVGEPAKPTNQDILKKGESYRVKSEGVFIDAINQVSTFILRELTPGMVGLVNGAKDARDILVTAYSEEPELQTIYTKLNSTLQMATNLKIARFVASLVNLSPEDTERMVSAVLEQDGAKTSELSQVLAALQKDGAERREFIRRLETSQARDPVRNRKEPK